MGYWTDLKDSYVTYHSDFIESVWNVIKTVHAKNLLYQDYRVVPWCTRCGTALSSHELAQGYKDVKDLSVYVAFKLVGRDESILVWTTTPWTLPSNIALAVKDDITYVKIDVEGKKLWLAKSRLPLLFPDAKILEEKKDRNLLGFRMNLFIHIFRKKILRIFPMRTRSIRLIS